MVFPTSRATFLLIFLGLFWSDCNGEGYPAPPNCAHLECPPYTVVDSDKEFEIRSYKGVLWVSAPTIKSKSYEETADKGFLILFGYYRGSNRENVKINMTAPVLVDVQNSAYTVYFYVPTKYQNGNLPPPLSTDQVKQVKLPKRKNAAVRRFDGFITNDNIPIQVAALKKSLKGTPYQRVADLDQFTVAGYNSPFEPTNRVNEVFLWFD